MSPEQERADARELFEDAEILRLRSRRLLSEGRVDMAWTTLLDAVYYHECGKAALRRAYRMSRELAALRAA